MNTRPILVSDFASAAAWNPFAIPEGDQIAAGAAALDTAEPLCRGLLESETITMLSGAPATFKSMFAYHMSRAIAAGEPFAGHPTRKTRVVYIDRENPRRTLATRAKLWPAPAGFFLWGSHHDPAFLPLPALDSGNLKENRPPDLGSPTLTEWLCREPTLLILDSFVRFHSEPETEAYRMARVWDILRFHRNQGTTILLIHHTTTETSRPRGGSEVIAGADLILHTSRPAPHLLLLIEQKNRDEPERQTALTFSALGFEPSTATPRPTRRRRRPNANQPNLFREEGD